MQQLSAQDASFIYSETPNAHMHVATLALYDQSTAPGGRVRFRDILGNIEQRLHLAKCFRRKLVEVPGETDHPYWIEDRNFDLEFHVRHVALPPPGDWTQFCKQAARLHSYPLDRSKPLWELTVISGLRAMAGVPDGAFGLLLKIHHAAIDGASGAALTEVLHDLTAAPAKIPRPQTVWVGESEPAPFELMSRSAMNNFMQPFRAAEMWTQTVPALRRAADRLRAHPVDPIGPVPRTRFNGNVTPHRVFDGRRYRLEDLRAMKQSVKGATINDAVLAVVGGALRKYLSDRSELPSDSLIAMAPINVRTADEKNTEGNKVAAMLASLCTHIENPADRLAAVRDSTHNSKVFTSAIGARRSSPRQPRFAVGQGYRLGTALPAPVPFRPTGHRTAAAGVARHSQPVRADDAAKEDGPCLWSGLEPRAERSAASHDHARAGRGVGQCNRRR